MPSFTSDPCAVPAFVPVLSRGAHLSPVDGACFMEYASVLAGEPFSDHPSCTHPVLARLSRAVNDLMSDTGRQRLAVLVPAVIGTNRRDPRLTAALIIDSVTRGLAAEPGDPHLARIHREAVHRLALAGRGRVAQAYLRATERDTRAVGGCAAARSALLMYQHGARDAELEAMLTSAVNACSAAPTGAAEPMLGLRPPHGNGLAACTGTE